MELISIWIFPVIMRHFVSFLSKYIKKKDTCRNRDALNNLSVYIKYPIVTTYCIATESVLRENLRIVDNHSDTNLVMHIPEGFFPLRTHYCS